jgi:hypothetical protein
VLAPLESGPSPSHPGSDRPFSFNPSAPSTARGVLHWLGSSGLVKPQSNHAPHDVSIG